MGLSSVLVSTGAWDKVLLRFRYRPLERRQVSVRSWYWPLERRQVLVPYWNLGYRVPAMSVPWYVRWCEVWNGNQ